MKDYPDKMTPEQARTFKDDVLNIVGQIPCGYVTTYGHIAALAGWPSHSRMVGRTLRYTPGAESLPCRPLLREVHGRSRRRFAACGCRSFPFGCLYMIKGVGDASASTRFATTFKDGTSDHTLYRVLSNLLILPFVAIW